MQGVYIEVEMNNYGCFWGGGVYLEEQLEVNKVKNDVQIDKFIKWANVYLDIICCILVGNEVCVDWIDYYVLVGWVIVFVCCFKGVIEQFVIFCENYVFWMYKLCLLVQEVDFIFIYIYLVWEYKYIYEFLEYIKENYYGVVDFYLDILVVIIEAGWIICFNGQGIDFGYVNEIL